MYDLLTFGHRNDLQDATLIASFCVKMIIKITIVNKSNGVISVWIHLHKEVLLDVIHLHRGTLSVQKNTLESCIQINIKKMILIPLFIIASFPSKWGWWLGNHHQQPHIAHRTRSNKSYHIRAIMIKSWEWTLCWSRWKRKEAGRKLIVGWCTNSSRNLLREKMDHVLMTKYLLITYYLKFHLDHVLHKEY